MPAGYGVGGYSTGTGTSAGGIASPEGVDNESIGGGGVSPGEGPSNGGNVFSKIGNFVKGIVSGTPQKNQRTVPSSQNFLQGSLPKGYTISKSGNTVYAPTTPTARERVENQFAGIDPDVAFRGAVAGINPETGTMFSGATKGGALDQFTNSMMTPQRDRQNTSRTDKYAAQSRNALRSQKGKVGLTAEQREINRKESLFNLDLDGDGNIFSSTDDDGVVYGMSNKAIYDPSLPEAYRGIPSRYATGLPTTNAATGALGNVYGGQKTSEDRMLANEIMSYVMPGAGIVKGVNWAKGKLAPKTETETETVANKGMTDNQFTNFIGGLNFNQPDFVNLPQAEKNKFMSSTSPYTEKVTAIPVGEYNPLVGYKQDGSPVYAQDPDAAQYRGVGM